MANNLPSVKPADGLISSIYDSEPKHFGIDIVNIEGTPIFATADEGGFSGFQMILEIL